MTTEEIRDLLNATPFRPFNIHLSDGMNYTVEHPDFVAISPNDRSVAVYAPRLQMVAVSHITRLEPLTPVSQD